jgi:AraC family cel operon transcriptional repressor
MAVITWASLSPLAAGCHLARGTVRSSYHVDMHGHDFAEVFWVESGRVRHDTPRGHRELGPGDAVIVRPDHVHALRTVGSDPGIVVNIAISAATLRELETRYRDVPGWPWRPADEPRAARLGAADLVELPRRIEELRAGPDDALAREAFLIDLSHRLRPRAATTWAEAPPWLAAALDRLAEPPLLSEGLPGLVRLCGRSREHVSRSIRAATGRTAHDLISELRLRWAERRLVLSDDAVGTIASACGFASRASFHGLFLKHHGRSPLAWRRASRTVVP